MLPTLKNWGLNYYTLLVLYVVTDPQDFDEKMNKKLYFTRKLKLLLGLNTNLGLRYGRETVAIDISRFFKKFLLLHNVLLIIVNKISSFRNTT